MQKHRWVVAVMTTFAVVFFFFKTLVYWEPLFYGKATGRHDEDTVEVFYANVNSQNKRKSKLISYLRRDMPHLVILIEINQSWVQELKSLESIYPHSKLIVQEGNFGLGVLSQTAMKVERVFVDRENLIPALILKVKTLIGEVNVAALHAFPPLGDYGTLMRNQYLSSLSHQLRDFDRPLLVCGDFNTTPWSASFQAFLKTSGLKLSAIHPAPQTWPAVPFVPKIPLDHCLSGGLNMINYEVGQDIGSDHLPLLLKIAFGKRGPAEVGE